MAVATVEKIHGTESYMARNSESDVSFWLVRDLDSPVPTVISVFGRAGNRNDRYLNPNGATYKRVLKAVRLATSTEVAEAVAEFDKVTQRYADNGASDTEPRAEFGDLFEAAVEGRAYRLPRTIDDWSLYHSEAGFPGSGKAARELTKAAKKVVDAVKRNRAEGIKVFEYRHGYVPFGARQDGVW